MYTAIYLNFGKREYEEEYSAKFKTGKLKDLQNLNLFNYSMSEDELGVVFYLTHYGGYNGPFARYFVVVKENDEKGKEEAKERLLEEAMSTLKKRIDVDTAIYNVLKEKKTK